MKIFKNKQSLRKELFKVKNVCFIPTMGGLHRGHLSLIKRAKKYKRKILVSIYVNPKQFNKLSDYKSYPRNLIKDIGMLKKININYLFLPSEKDIYTFKTSNKIFMDKFSKQLCGKFRKDHFRSVIDVVNRFLEIIEPKYIFLGLKDFQQLYLIKKHILKRKISTKVIECKTVREKNGVACSSRNINLSDKDIKIASKIYYYLYNLKKKLKTNFNSVQINKIKKYIYDLGVDKIEYVQYININNSQIIKKKNKTNKQYKMFIAYYLKKVRLIDNI
jgi:pantoate--beta-alanine ligase|tara:strand:- start:794 stop:1618 length:825 start_codon:yes stop_codon:yes gene_type:complete